MFNRLNGTQLQGRGPGRECYSTLEESQTQLRILEISPLIWSSHRIIKRKCSNYILYNYIYTQAKNVVFLGGIF